MLFRSNPLSTAVRSVVISEFQKRTTRYPSLLKPTLSFAIAPGGLVVVMVPAVELDDQMRGRAEKVHDIGTNRRLSPEVGSLDRQSF